MGPSSFRQRAFSPILCVQSATPPFGTKFTSDERYLLHRIKSVNHKNRNEVIIQQLNYSVCVVCVLESSSYSINTRCGSSRQATCDTHSNCYWLTVTLCVHISSEEGTCFVTNPRTVRWLNCQCNWQRVTFHSVCLVCLKSLISRNREREVSSGGSMLLVTKREWEWDGLPLCVVVW